MSFPVPSTINSQLDAINSSTEELFKAGDMTRLVEQGYHKDGKALAPGQHVHDPQPSSSLQVLSHVSERSFTQ